MKSITTRAMPLLASAMLLSLIGVGSVSATWTGNTSYNVGQTINGNLSVNIPSKYQTINYTNGIAEVQQSYCSYFIGINGIPDALERGTPNLIYGDNYTQKFDYTPTMAGKYAFGVVCQVTQNTFVNGAWTGWSAFDGYSNESVQDITVYPVSTSPPSSVPSIVSFWDKIMYEWIQSVIASL